MQPPRPTLAKVNKTCEQYRHYNALVIVLLVRKILKMKFLLSCTSSRQDLKVLIKYYRREVQLAYLVDFAQFLLRFAPHLTFLHSKLVLHSQESLFTGVRLHLFFYLVLYLQLVGAQEAYKIQLARGTACIFSRLCPISTMVCFKFYFAVLQISLTLLRITFFKNTYTSIQFCLVLCLYCVGS